MRPFITTDDAGGATDAQFRFHAGFVQDGSALTRADLEAPRAAAPDTLGRAPVRLPDTAAPGAELGAAPVETLAAAHVQAATPADHAPAIGQVSAVQGSVVVLRNGVAVTLNAGDPVFKNDVIQNQGEGSAAGIVLSDGSILQSAGEQASAPIDVNVLSAAGLFPDMLVETIEGVLADLGRHDANNETSPNLLLAHDAGGSNNTLNDFDELFQQVSAKPNDRVANVANQDDTQATDDRSSEQPEDSSVAPMNDTVDPSPDIQVRYVEAVFVSDRSSTSLPGPFMGDGTPNEVRAWVSVTYQGADTWKIEVPGTMAALAQTSVATGRVAQASAGGAAPSDSFAFASAAAAPGSAAEPPPVQETSVAQSSATSHVTITSPGSGETATLVGVHGQQLDPNHHFHIIV